MGERWENNFALALKSEENSHASLANLATDSRMARPATSGEISIRRTTTGRYLRKATLGLGGFNEAYKKSKN